MVGVVLSSGLAWAAPAAPTTNEAPADVFVLRRFEWIPAFKMPRTSAALVPRRFPVASIQAMDVAGGQLWASVRSYQQTNPPDGSGRLWSFQARTGMLAPVPGPLEHHSVTALHGQPGTLWLGLDGGLASLDLATHSIHPYGAAEGMISTNIVGIGEIDDTVVALGRYGLLWGLVPGTASFVRANAGAPGSDPRVPELWRSFATSGDWMLAASDSAVAARHYRSPQWLTMRDELANGSPHLTPPRFTSVAGDGEGSFWIGSTAGLHWLNPESNVVENRFSTPAVTVLGGLGMTVAPGFRPTAGAYVLARERVMQGIRERMRDRARHARVSSLLKQPVSPLWPVSRLPGGVTALHRDGRFLWVATQDGAQVLRSRILLLHQPTRRWVGWFPVAAPVTCLATDAQRLWVGSDVTRTPSVAPLFAVDKLSLMSVPQTQWTRDAMPDDEVAEHMAGLPVKERAVLAFFGGDPQKVIELLAPTGEAAPEADAETLFLLAFAHDAVGLNQPERLEHYVGRLREEHSESLFAELAAAVRSARPAARAAEDAPPDEVAEPPPIEPPPSAPAPLPITPAPSPADAVLKARDLGKDGRLNGVEFRLWRGPRADFNAADTNHDGQLEAAEIEELLKSESTPGGASSTSP